MSDESQGSRAPAAEPVTVRVAQDIPAIYCDGIASQTFTHSVAKFYFSRLDTDPAALSPGKETYLVQVVMPLDGFVQSLMFLEHRLTVMVERGYVKQQELDEARRFWADVRKRERDAASQQN